MIEQLGVAPLFLGVEIADWSLTQCLDTENNDPNVGSVAFTYDPPLV